MTSLILKYPLDLRGNSSTNLVLGERHTLPAEGNRVIIPNYGPFYTEGLVVRNYSTGEELDKYDQWKAVQLYTEAVQRTGKEVCAVIVITDDEVTSEIEIDYQVVGGQFSRAVPVIQQLIDDLEIDEREVEWGDILAAPDAFPPVSHLHDAGDLYGFEYVVSALEQVHDAILIGDAAAHQEIINTLDNQVQIAQSERDQIDGRVTDHVNDFTNPHQVTKSQTGLGNVENYVIANQAEAEAGVRADAYMTPLRVAQAIATQSSGPLSTHVADTSNPHQVTKTQVGLSDVVNYGVATQSEAEAGTVNNKYMTPLRVAEAVYEQVGDVVDIHLNNFANPHNVTKSHVGLGDVENYGVASVSQAEGGTNHGTYMTPLLVNRAIDAQITPALISHINDTANPHSVSKSQVGLGNVANYDIASSTEAEEGTVNNKYMTPLRVSEAISSQTGDILDAHTTNTSNPHSVTKAQVGLGDVQNYAIATAFEAVDGTSNTKYMTPRRVDEHFTNIISDYLDPHFTSTSNPHNVTKAQVGLGDVENYAVASTAEAEAGAQTGRYMTPALTRSAIEAIAPTSSVANEAGWSLWPFGNSGDNVIFQFRRFEIGPYRYVQLKVDGYSPISSHIDTFNGNGLEEYIPEGSLFRHVAMRRSQNRLTLYLDNSMNIVFQRLSGSNDIKLQIGTTSGRWYGGFFTWYDFTSNFD